MASDPYGFPEASADAGAPGDAVRALWTGVAAMILGAMAPCCCYLPWFLALPASCVAVYYGARASKLPASAGEGDRAAAQAGLVTGLVGLVLSLLWVGIFLVYVVYALVMLGALGADLL